MPDLAHEKARKIIDYLRVMNQLEREYFRQELEDIDNKIGPARADARRQAEERLIKAMTASGHTIQ